MSHDHKNKNDATRLMGNHSVLLRVKQQTRSLTSDYNNIECEDGIIVTQLSQPQVH